MAKFRYKDARQAFFSLMIGVVSLTALMAVAHAQSFEGEAKDVSALATCSPLAPASPSPLRGGSARPQAGRGGV